MAWFGAAWGAPVCTAEDHVETPVGTPCLHCQEPIEDEDCGIMTPHYSADGMRVEPMHLECNLRMLVGGLNHLRGDCLCCGGTLPPDPPDLPVRAAARVAATYWQNTLRARRSSGG